jgi:glycosyltransferase involved in cell wall biosynthesis
LIWEANFGVDVDVQKALDPNRENICYSNRMHEPLYQIQHILDTFLAMQGKITMKLILGGKGSLHDTFLKFIETHKLQDSIEIVGFVDKEVNKKNYLRSKFFLSIPTSDGTSISLLEAMAYGCIPILSNLASNGDWVEDGINGILIQDSETVQDAIHRGMLLDAGKVQARNREIIAQRATKAANARIFLEIYDKLLASDTEAKR